MFFFSSVDSFQGNGLDFNHHNTVLPVTEPSDIDYFFHRKAELPQHI